MKFVINGDFVEKSITGVQRYAYEITKHLDSVLEGADYGVELLIPEDATFSLQLKNIRVVRHGKGGSILWRQFFLPLYCRRNHAVCVCMCTVPPLLYAAQTILVVHDASTLVNPDFYSKKYLLYNRIFCWSQKIRLKEIVTVSNFSKDELNRAWLKGSREPVVIENAADHVLDISPDDTVMDKYGLEKGSYYYALSSLSPNKNFKWILKNAEYNPSATYVVSGKVVNIYADTEFGDIPDNVIFTGYVSDSEMAALMLHCKAFVFPTLYEGFGITPLEALELGKKIIISDIPVMREIYEDAAAYVNPCKYDYSIDALYEDALAKANTIAGKYSWEKSAEKWESLLKRVKKLEDF